MGLARSLTPERLRAFSIDVTPRKPDVLEGVVTELTQSVAGPGVSAPRRDEIDSAEHGRPKISIGCMQKAGVPGLICIQLFGDHEVSTTKLQLRSLPGFPAPSNLCRGGCLERDRKALPSA